MQFTEEEVGELTYLVNARIAELEVEEKSAKRMKNLSIIEQETTLLEAILEKLGGTLSGGRRRKNRKTRKNRKD